MDLAHRFADFRERVPKNDAAVANISDRDDLRRSLMHFPVNQSTED
jgi:hypothetical protein